MAKRSKRSKTKATASQTKALKGAIEPIAPLLLRVSVLSRRAGLAHEIAEAALESLTSYRQQRRVRRPRIEWTVIEPDGIKVVEMGIPGRTSTTPWTR